MENNELIDVNVEGSTELIDNSNYQRKASMDLVEIFSLDHDKIIDLFNKVKKGRSRKMKYFKELILLMLAHADAEEVALFENSAITTNVQRYKRLISAEHETIRRQIQSILDTYEDDDMWGSRFDVLEKLSLKHMNEETEITMDSMFENTQDMNISKVKEDYQRALDSSIKKCTQTISTGIVLKEMDLIPHGSILNNKR